MKEFWEQESFDKSEERSLKLSKRLIEDGRYPQLLEFAQTEHRRFVYYFISEGWGYSTKKNPKLRKHDCLCTWEHLVDTRPETLIYDLISSPNLMNRV